MEARARARYMRVTPRKARRVVDLIRGMPAEEARAMLSFAPQSASDPIGKVLASAIANAEHTGRTTASSLVVSGAWVDEGPTLRRFRARAQGRPARINKRTSHITIVVSDETPAARKLAAAAGAGASSRGGSARGTAGRGASARGGSSRRTSSRSASDETAATGAANTEGTD